MTEVFLKCRCGAMRGTAYDVAPNTGTRVVCYCDDCQRFARHLGRESEVLDAYGGTDIYQMPPARVKITEGLEYLRCLRLTPKGMYRWYAGCCNTPIGNTLSAGVPFVGVIHSFMDDDGARDAILGPVQGYTQTRFAGEGLPDERKQAAFPFGLMLKSVLRLLKWKLTGGARPSPFFDSRGQPISEPHIPIPVTDRPG